MGSILGRRFGRLVSVARVNRSGSNAKITCRCDCGTVLDIGAANLVSGRTVSCGCRMRELNASIGKTSQTHGLSKTREYETWSRIIQRCHNPNSAGFRKYGARGIFVCDRWRESFDKFLADMGPRPPGEYSIDRIDNTGGYTPDNCRWATPSEQARNTSRTRLVEFKGETLCFAEWAERAGMREQTLRHRLKRGWSFERAIGTPLKRVPSAT